MIYAYLSDTALTPLLTNSSNIDQPITDYQGYAGLKYDATTQTWSGGVAQINERILTMFNSEYTIDIPTQADSTKTMAQQYPNLIMDPRTPNTNVASQAYQTGRLLGLFSGDASYVRGTSTERAVGRMALHYDAYLAAKDANPTGSGGEKGNLIANLTVNATNDKQFAQLFNVIEACVFSHVYNAEQRCWMYKNASDLNTILSSSSSLYGSGSSTENKAGYIYGSIIVPTCDFSSDKSAKVRNKNTADSTGLVKTGIGSDDTLDGYNASVLFPDYIQFSFRFTGLTQPTIFRIYLNPDTFLKQYAKTTITHVVCAADPNDLVALDYANAEVAITEASYYVANCLTNEITKTNTNPLMTPGFTGASSISTRYVVPMATDQVGSEYRFTFTCIFKGRSPTAAEMREKVREILETANGGESVEDLFPDLYVSISYIIVPMYDTRITADTNVGITYCSNIYQTNKMLLNYNGLNSATVRSEVPSALIDNCSNMNCPAYYMHMLAYPEDYAGESGKSIERLDEVECFESYQPIGSTDVYWGTLTEEARELNRILSTLIAAQLYGTVPSGVSYTVDTRAIFGEGKSRTYWTFTVGAYSFSLMTRESYMSSSN